MRILIVGLVKNEQLKRLAIEGKKRGHIVDGCYTSELIIDSDINAFSPYLKEKEIEDYDLIYLWAVGKRRWEWYAACYFLSKKCNTKIVNEKIIDPSYNYFLTPAIDYLKQYENKIDFPRSSIIFKATSIEKIIKNYKFPVIMKKSEGRQGKGIYLIKDLENLKKLAKKELETATSVCIREFIPNEGDIRVFTVGYKAIGAMRRIPPKGDFRSNISQGGKGEPFDLEKNPKVKEIAEKLSKLTKTEIAGVDIMLHKENKKPYVLELNPGPQFMGLEKYTDTNAALEIIKYFEEL